VRVEDPHDCICGGLAAPAARTAAGIVAHHDAAGAIQAAVTVRLGHVRAGEALKKLQAVELYAILDARSVGASARRRRRRYLTRSRRCRCLTRSCRRRRKGKRCSRRAKGRRTLVIIARCRLCASDRRRCTTRGGGQRRGRRRPFAERCASATGRCRNRVPAR
jgi:hypothetical protein